MLATGVGVVVVMVGGNGARLVTESATQRG